MTGVKIQNWMHILMGIFVLQYILALIWTVWVHGAKFVKNKNLNTLVWYSGFSIWQVTFIASW